MPARAVPGPDGRHREHRPAPPTRDQRRWALHCLGTRWPVSRRRAPRRPEARAARRASLSRRARPHCPAGTRPGRCGFCFRRGRRCQAGVQVCYLSGDSLGPALPRTRVHCPANRGEEMRALPVPAASFLLRCRNLVLVLQVELVAIPSLHSNKSPRRQNHSRPEAVYWRAPPPIQGARGLCPC